MDDERRAMGVAFYDLLATGEPVSNDALADRAGHDREAVALRLAGWSNVFRDREGRITGYGGLALFEMGHASRLAHASRAQGRES